MNEGSWAVNSVEILDQRVRVVFTTERGHKAEFTTRKFGLAGRVRASALAKFVTKSGLVDDVMFAYRFIRRLPRDYQGPLIFTPVIEEEQPVALSIVS